MGRFDDDTRIEPVGELSWSTRLHRAWCIGDTPNGGYAVSPVVRALTAATGRTAALSITTHFLRPTTADADAEIAVDVIREGRAASTARATLTQDGSTRLVVLAALGDLTSPDEDSTEHSDRAHVTIPPPELPPPDDCIDRAELDQGVELPILERLDVRVHPAHAVAGGAQRALMSGWVRFGDDAPPTEAALPLFADAFPPSLHPLVERVGWVPTMELTVHVRRQPADGWIRAQFECDDLSGGRMIESGTLWDHTGAVIARSRQLGLHLDR